MPDQPLKLLQKLWHGADYNYEQWLDSPDVLDEDFRLMKLARCNIMSVGIFAWAMLEPAEGAYNFDWLDRLLDRLAEAGMSAALATPSAAPPAWLPRQYPETRRINEHGLREPHRRRQNFCYSSPVYREKTLALDRRLAERYADHPALALWHVSNEYLAVPCYCESCLGKFRGWLQARYGDLETLNRAWWTTFWSHRYGDWDEIEPVDPSLHGLMLDWQRFTSDQALDFFLAESAVLRAITPGVPLTTNFMQPDLGLNYRNFAGHVDVVVWDSYPRWHVCDDVTTAMQTAFVHDLYRAYKGGQPFLLMETTPSVTNWQGLSRLKRPGMHKLSSLQAVAHGANGVQYFQWRQSRGGEEKFHGAVVTHRGMADTRTFRDVAEVGRTLANLSAVTQTTVRPSVAVIYDCEIEWALNHAQLTGNLHKQYRDTCERHYRVFWERSIATDVIHAAADFSPYRILVAPMLYLLEPGVAERLEAFVQAGGILVTTYLSGLVNESDLCFTGGDPPALWRTLGLYVEEQDTLTDTQSGTITTTAGSAFGFQGDYTFRHYADLVHLETAQALAAYSSEFYAGCPALTVNRHGAGQAYYLAARTEDRFLAALYGALASLAGVTPDLPVSVPPGVSVRVRENAAQRLVFLLNFTDAAQTLTLAGDLTDAESGATAGPDLTLPPYGAAVLVQERSRPETQVARTVS